MNARHNECPEATDDLGYNSRQKASQVGLGLAEAATRSSRWRNAKLTYARLRPAQIV
jgi:hypothetical protein